MPTEGTFAGLVAGNSPGLAWISSKDLPVPSDVFEEIEEIEVWRQVNALAAISRQRVPIPSRGDVLGVEAAYLRDGESLILSLYTGDRTWELWRYTGNRSPFMTESFANPQHLSPPIIWAKDQGRIQVTNLETDKSIEVEVGDNEIHDVLFQNDKVLLLVGDEPHLIERWLKFEN